MTNVKPLLSDHVWMVEKSSLNDRWSLNTGCTSGGVDCGR